MAKLELEEVYARLEENKKRRREINKMYKDELTHNARYQEIMEEMATLKSEKQGIEYEIKSGSGEFAELEDLKSEISADSEVISDIALNMYVEGETVEIIDKNDTKWFPVFKVSFKKE